MEKWFTGKLMCVLAFLAIVGLGRATIVIQDDFNDDPLYGQPSNPPWNVAATPSGQLNRVDPDGGNVFGEGTSNKYLRMRLQSGTGGPLVRGIRNYATGASAVSIRFDFVDASNDFQNTAVRFAFGGAGWGTNYWQALDFRANSVRDYAGETLATYGAGKHTLEIIANANTAGIIYYGNAFSESVAPGKFDLWLDGVKIADDKPRQLNDLVSPFDFQDFEFQIAAFTTGGTREFYFDNFTVTKIPEPATVALLGIGSSVLFLRRKK